MKKMTGTIMAFLLSTLIFTACSKDEQSIAEKTSSKIDEITTKTADVMVKRIKSPIDKARLTQNLGDKRLEEMDRALQNQ